MLAYGQDLLIPMILLQAVYVVVYRLSRGLKPFQGSVLLVGGLACGIMVANLLYGDVVWGNALVWFIIPILLASILLP
jgi:hypothetical protein